MTGNEQQFFARAEVHDDTGELAQAVAAVLAGAQAAGVDPAAVANLAAATRALDPGASAGYDPGRRTDRRPGGGYRSDGEFLEAVSEAEADVREQLQEVDQLRDALAAAADAAQAALAGAYAMPVKERCDGCHSAKEAAIADALRRIGLCEAAAEVLDPLAQRLQAALGHLQQVPADLGEVYELVYQFIRKGGKLPAYGRWIEGSTIRLPSGNPESRMPVKAMPRQPVHVLTGDDGTPSVADAGELAEAVKRLAVVAVRDTRVRLAISPGQIELTAGSGDEADGTVTIACELDGDPLTIAFHPHRLLDAITAVGTGRVRIALTTPAKAVLITPAGDGQDDDAGPACRHLLMPIRTAG
jgi:DNA polymerase III beta subunit, C-terminal domain